MNFRTVVFTTDNRIIAASTPTHADILKRHVLLQDLYNSFFYFFLQPSSALLRPAYLNLNASYCHVGISAANLYNYAVVDATYTKNLFRESG